MKTRRSFVTWGGPTVLLLVLLGSFISAKQRESNKYLCSEPSPQGICNPSSTCGSAAAPCVVDIKRAGNGASLTPSIPNAKGNQPFCVNAGTTITWESRSKNTGFILDFGPSSPFDQDTIIGGSDRSVSAVAKKPGCYKFSAGACTPGSIYGMCSESSAEIVVIRSGQ